MSNFEAYKLCDERIQRLSERRQTSSQTYLSINTIIFSVFAFLVKDAGLKGWNMLLISLPLLLMGVLACVVWIKIITDFKKIIGWHYEQLREMENNFPENYRTYTKEWEKFFKPQNKREKFSFSRLEGLLPRILIMLYIIYCSIMLISAANL